MEQQRYHSRPEEIYTDETEMAQPQVSDGETVNAEKVKAVKKQIPKVKDKRYS